MQILARRAGPRTREGMVELDGGEFDMGNEREDANRGDGEGPVRRVKLGPFLIDRTAVSNRQFARFVRETGYVTESERFGWSFVFHTHLPTAYRESLRTTRAVVGLEWWLSVPGASWSRPRGGRSSIDAILDHPVVHVTWNDAAAYCLWAGKRLPTEAEWEYAARGGLAGKRFPWGDELQPGGRHRCNVWQGRFPDLDAGEDGYRGTCEVDAFEPNAWGLYNVCGNVWEWCADWFSADHHAVASQQTRVDPRGPSTGRSRVQKGGSFLCHSSYCNRYRVAARTGNTPDSASANLGFRCAADA